MKKILLFNLITIFIIFCILEFISYIYIRNDAAEYMQNSNKYAKENNLPLYTQRYAPVRGFNQKNFESVLRKPQLGDSNKYTIIFFGCSYMFGFLEKEENTIPYIINKKTGITTVNQAIPGGSILNTLYYLNDDTFYNKITKLPPVKYIVYLYITDHINRIANPYRATITKSDNAFYEVNPKIEIKEKGIEIKHYSKIERLFMSLYTVKAYHYLYSNRFKHTDSQTEFNNLLIKAKQITDNKFPGSKFIVILYKDGGHTIMSQNKQDELKQKGFIILNAEELAGHELDSANWRAQDKEHPNAEAFKDVSTGLIKILNL